MTRLLRTSYIHSLHIPNTTVAMVVPACLSSHVRSVSTCMNFPQPPYLGNIPVGEVVVHMAVVGEGPPAQGSTRGYKGHSQAVGGGGDHHRVGHRVVRSSLKRERGENFRFQVSKHKLIC